MLDDRLAARVKPDELSQVVARDGHDLLVLGLEELDELEEERIGLFRVGACRAWQAAGEQESAHHTCGKG